MNKEIKIALISTGAVVVGYLLYKRFSKTKKTSAFAPKSNSSVTFVPPTTELANQSISRICKFPIKKNVYDCYYVKALQFALNNIPRATTPGNIGCEKKCNSKPLVIDGDWGTKTQQLLDDTFGSDAFPNGVSASDLEQIYSYVITDPVAYQEAENPNIIAPKDPPPTTIDWSTGVPVVVTR